jgi:hypothetical protein
MGTGAGAGSKFYTPQEGEEIEAKYGIKAEKLINEKGALYCNLERRESKLSLEVITHFEKYNNFSKDLDETPNPNPNIKTKNTRVPKPR